MADKITMKPFVASDKAAAHVISLRKASVDDPPQLNFTSIRAATSGEHSGDIVKEAIGEGVIRALGQVALHGIARNPDATHVLVATRSSFMPEVAQTLAARLGVTASCAAQGALDILAAELFAWASREPFARDLRIEVDDRAGTVFVRSSTGVSASKSIGWDR